MGLIRWLIAIVVLAAWSALIGTALYVAMYEPATNLPEAEAIVVLSGDVGALDGMNDETAERVARGVELYEAGVAPMLIMTGGTLRGSETAIAESMKAAALEAGVPENAIVIEDAAQSTLQNALFVADLGAVDPAAPIVLVSSRYHLPRANASFRWAGFGDLTNVASDAGEGFEFSSGLLWEGVKWPLNVVRAAAASAAMAGNVPRESYIQYLN